MNNKIMPFNSEQLDNLQLIFKDLSTAQLNWLSGYLWGLSCSDNLYLENVNKDRKLRDNICLFDQKITLISASQTGNARKLAEQLRDDFIAVNLKVVLFNAGDYKFKQINKEVFLILITSTYGEGEPPEEAISLYKYLFSKKALRMEHTYFAVFSFGDKSYEHFAKAGKDFDKKLEELGAQRLCDRVDVDVNFEKDANMWRKKIVSIFEEKMRTLVKEKDGAVHNIYSSAITKKDQVVYSKKFPFIAYLSCKQKITSCNSLKDIHHLEIDISGSNLRYYPGDALGVWYENDVCLVNELLELLELSGNELVQVQGRLISLEEALRKNYELTHNTVIVTENLSVISKNKVLLSLLNNTDQLNEFISTTPIIEMFRQTSIKLSAQDLLKTLIFMKPRFYSIASAQEEVGDEVHITVSVIRYESHGHSRAGGASSYLVDRLKENDKVRIFIQCNNNFRLPSNPNASIIMIGSGTGIAPFRAFMQQRSFDKALGRNWLFFGNLSFINDFLYQIEWQSYMKVGLLTKISTAWSRDQNKKIYVQDQLLKNSIDVWNWIKEGAYIYVCGDAKRMARDVNQALIILTSKHGNMNLERASEFWDEMRLQNRYQRDIY